MTKNGVKSSVKIQLGREEYQAFISLRDEMVPQLQAHNDDLMVRHAKMQQNLNELVVVNTRQLSLLTTASLTVEAFREKQQTLEAEIKRLSQLETPDKLLERTQTLEEIVKQQHATIQLLQQAHIFTVQEKLRVENKALREEVKNLKVTIAAGKPL